MDPDRHARLQNLFFRAIELPTGDRERMIGETCGDDREMAEALGRLLAAHDSPAPLFDSGNPVPSPGGAASTPAMSSLISTGIQARKCLECSKTFPDSVHFCPHDGEMLVFNPEVLVGTLFDEVFEIESLLGEGGMGTVYRARHRLLRDVVALKLLPGDVRNSPHWRKRFLREGQAARRFRHPNAVVVYDLRVARDGTIYLVLEYVEGRTLRAELRERRRFSCSDALKVFETIASVLDTAHAAGVVHRDLKPENVMLTPGEAGLKVLDLGVAGFLAPAPGKETGKLTQAGAILGTPRYMPPEQWGEVPDDGVAGVDGRADIYSLGVMAFEMICGQPPYRAERIEDMRRLHTTGPTPDPRNLNAEIPQRYALAIVRAMAKNRGDRFSTAGEFVRELRAGLGLAEAATNAGPIAYPTDSGAAGQTPPAGDTGIREAGTGAGAGETACNPPTNLPPQATSFVGRHEEVDRIARTLRSQRLVTLLGPGGIGKTRLAVQVCREVLDVFPDGVWFADLSALADPALVASTVADSFGVREHGTDSLVTNIVGTVGERRVLFVLDNCEHVRKACTALAAEVLRGCPNARILATSREALGLPAEHVWDVPPLALPPSNLSGESLIRAAETSEAVRLFVDRAKAVRGAFKLTDQNVVPVVALCRRLEGIPLAVELAAARTGVLAPAQILARIEKRLDLLANRHAGVPDRHRTLRASIEWSHQLLPAPLQDVFARLSVFRGGWTLDAAERVFAVLETAPDADPVDALEQLRECSLVAVEEHADEMRFRMLETIREFAADQMPSESWPPLRLAHARYFLEFIERADAELAGPEQAFWLARIAADLENLRAAIDWCLSGAEGETGLRLAAALGRFWTVRGLAAEGRATLKSAIEHNPAAPPELRAKALNWAGNLASLVSDLETARDFHERALALRRDIDDKPGIAISLHNLGGIAADQCDFARADALYDECLRIATQLGDKLRIGQSLVNRGRAASERGDYPAAMDLLERGIALLVRHGHTYGVCVGLLCLGDAAQCSGDFDRAERSLSRSLAQANEIGETTASGYSLCGLGSVARYRGRLDEAVEFCDRALAIARDLGAEDLHATALAILGEIALLKGNAEEAGGLLRQSLKIRARKDLKSGIAACLESLALVALEQTRMRRAARLLGAARSLRAIIGVPTPGVDRVPLAVAEARVRAALGAGAYGVVQAEIAQASISDVVAEALQ